VDLLPEEIRSHLNKQLILHAFGNYQQLADELAVLGYEITKSSLHRYGQKFQKELFDVQEATEQAKALVEACGDDENALPEAVTRLIYQKTLRVLMELDFGEGEGEEEENRRPKISLPMLGRMVADLNKSSVYLQRYKAEVRKKLEERLRRLEEEADKAEKEGKPQHRKLDKETLRVVREDIYGLF
jgi:hypothetical protein